MMNMVNKAMIFLCVFNVFSAFSQDTMYIYSDDIVGVPISEIDSFYFKPFERNEGDLETVTDYDGNNYDVVSIGEQIWMASNLKVTHYPNGERIQHVVESKEWQGCKIGAYCWYNYGLDNTGNDGALYNYDATTASNWTKDLNAFQGICPLGWHIPSHGEWSTLLNYVIAESDDSTYMSDLCDTDGWGNITYINQYGFSALPSGIRSPNGFFAMRGTNATWMSQSSLVQIGRNATLNSGTGASVRCVKDSITLPLVLTLSGASTAGVNISLGGDIQAQGLSPVRHRGIEYSTDSLLGNSKKVYDAQTGIGDFSVNVNDLTRSTTYYYRAFMSNSDSVTNGEIFNFQTGGIVSDVDGNDYKTVKIGNQIWMAENLRATHYPNGNEIPMIYDDEDWKAMDYDSTDAFVYYNFYELEFELDSIVKHGSLYNYSAAIANDLKPDGSSVQGVCPDGWHLPTNLEWKELILFVDSFDFVETPTQALKSTEGWFGNGTDLFDFNVRPSGYRFYNGIFYNMNKTSSFWTATDNSASYAKSIVFDISSIKDGESASKSSGYSVRCVKN